MKDKSEMGRPPVSILKTLRDNYSYLLIDHNNALVIDPAEAKPILKFLSLHHLKLSYVLNTHHHFDHVGGNHMLKENTQCIIMSPDSHATPDVDRVLHAGESITFGAYSIDVLGTPGHTSTSVTYYCHSHRNASKMVFTGDTLFCGGCGRISDSDPEVMWQSLQKIAALPDDVLVYPGHDYTAENYAFAASLLDDSERSIYAATLLKKNEPVPTTLGDEKKYNIFLRSGSQRLKERLGLSQKTDSEVFAYVRKRKDLF
jgi:hydroxyacylglutathione hydrolase